MSGQDQSKKDQLVGARRVISTVLHLNREINRQPQSPHCD